LNRHLLREDIIFFIEKIKIDSKKWVVLKLNKATITMSSAMENEFGEFIGFRKFEASIKTMSFFQNIKKEVGDEIPMNCLPLIDEKETTITHPTFQKHCKFAIRSHLAPKDEKTTYRLIIGILIKLYDISPEFFKIEDKKAEIVKEGLIVFPNSESSIRLWSSKLIGKNVVYEITVSSYKDAIPQPLDHKPSEQRKITVPH
jgi:hypothetical protein